MYCASTSLVELLAWVATATLKLQGFTNIEIERNGNETIVTVANNMGDNKDKSNSVKQAFKLE